MKRAALLSALVVLVAVSISAQEQFSWTSLKGRHIQVTYQNGDVVDGVLAGYYYSFYQLSGNPGGTYEYDGILTIVQPETDMSWNIADLGNKWPYIADDGIWEFLVNDLVAVELTDGLQVGGKLTRYDAKGIYISSPGSSVNVFYTYEAMRSIRNIDAEKKFLVAANMPMKTAGAAEVAAVPESEKKAQNAAQESPEEGSLTSLEHTWFFQLNTLGVVQFGPVLDLGYMVTDSVAVSLQFRPTALGLLTYAVSDGTPALYSFAVGPSVTWLGPTANGEAIGSRFYLGGFTAFALGGSSDDSEVGYEWEGDYAYIIVASSAGYRWQTRDRFYVNTGLVVGGNIVLWDEWWYTSDPSTVYDSESPTLIVAMLDLSLGWTF